MNRSLVCFSAAALIGGVSSPVFARFEDRADLMKRAQELSTAGKYVEAEKLLDRAIPLDPKDNLGWLLRGYVRMMQKNYDGATSDDSSGLVALALSNPSDVHLRAIAFTNRAAAWNDKGEPYRALVDALAACGAEATFAKAWLVRADIQYALGNLDQANICLEKARMIDAKVSRTFTADVAAANARKFKPIDDKADVNPAFKAAVQLQNEKKNDEALAAYSAILATNPLIGNAWGNRGNIYFDTRRDAEAIADYTVAITASGLLKDPENQAWSLTNRANVYVSQNRLAEAVNDLELAVKIKPDYQRAADILKDARAELASAPSESLPPLERAKKYVEEAEKAGIFSGSKPRAAAKKILDDLLQADAKNAPALVLSARLASIGMIGVTKEAREFIDRAIAADPKNPDALYEHALALTSGYSTNDADRAQSLRELKLAVALGRTDPPARIKLADALMDAKDYSGAGEQLDLAVSSDPQNANYLSKRAQLRYLQGDWRRSIDDRSKIVALQPTPANLANLADAYIDNKQYAEAIVAFDRSISLRPDDADNVVGRARAKRLKGDRVGALADYSKAHEMDATLPAVKPDLSDAKLADDARHDFKRLMGKIADSGKKLTEASVEVVKAERAKKKAEARLQRLFSGDRRTDAQILSDFETDKGFGELDEQDYLDHARVMGRQEKYDLGIADCARAISLKKDYDDAYNWRGVLYETKGEWEKAFADYDRAVSIRPKSATYLRNRGDVHYQLKRFDAAWADYDKAIIDEPRVAANYFKRGNASFQRGKYDDAIADYDKALELDPNLKAAADNREVAKRKKAGG